MSKAKNESDIAVEEMFRKEGIYQPLHIVTEQNIPEWTNSDESSNDIDSLNLDYAPNGGRSIVDGQLVNTNGDFIDEAGNVFASRLPGKRPIKFIIPEHKPFRKVETIKTEKIVDGHRLEKSEDFLVEKDWINSESATKEANDIFDKIDKKYQPKFKKVQAKFEKLHGENPNSDAIEKHLEELEAIEAIEAKRDTEYKRQLHKWLYPEETTKGRPLNSLNSNSKINRKDLKKYFWELHEEDEKLKQKDVAEKLNVVERTLRDYVKDRFKLKWKPFRERVICGEIEI